MKYIGVDLHKNNFVSCFLSKSGVTEFITYKIEELEEFIKKVRRSDIVGVEATGNTRFFVTRLKPYVSEIQVINPHQFKVVSESIKKTDKNDAETIAIYLSKGLLPQVRMKDLKFVELESLVNTRSKFVQLRVSLKNKIHSILLSQGILTKREQFSSKKSLARVVETPGLSEVAQFELKLICDQVTSLSDTIGEIDEKIIAAAEKLPGFENLISIKGIGKRSAAVLLAIIGEIKNFQSQKKLDAYFGVVPRIHNSNQTVIHGRITKRGSKLGRATLIQCTLIAIRYSSYLRRFFEKIRAAKGGGKAIIATSRKLLGIIYDTLTNNWVFEDFPNFVLKGS